MDSRASGVANRSGSGAARRLRSGLQSEVVRFLKSSPLTSIIAILSLALRIGANTAIFSIINSLLLRPLPVRDPERLALVSVPSNARGVLTPPIWEQIRQHRDLFESAAAWSAERFDISARGQSDLVEGIFVSGGFFETLGVRPLIGRSISGADDRPDAPDGPVAMISYSLWQERFAGRADAVGRTLTIARQPVTIVGVIPASFFGLEVGTAFDVAVPYAIEPQIHGMPSLLNLRTAWWVNVIVRRKPDQSLAQAAAALHAVQPAIRTATIPENESADETAKYLAEPFDLQSASRGISTLRGRYERPLITLMVVVVLVLLIACANIANLLLARTAARRHELTVRRALGASNARLAGHLIFESLVLSCLGAAIGLGLAVWGSRLLVNQLSTLNRVMFLDLSLDWRVLAFTVAATAFTALLFGSAPAIGAMRVQPNEILKQQARSVAGNRALSPSQLLVVAQVALSLVLVFAAGLFIRTFVTLTTQHTGFTRDRVLTVRVDTSIRNAKPEQVLNLYERFRAAAADVPGVASATMSAMTPVNGVTWQFLLELPDGPPMPESERIITANVVGPDYFTTLGTRLLEGRDFSRADGRLAPPVAIVNESFARKYLNGQSVVGRRIRQAGYFGRPSTDREIVGYVEDAVYRTLREASVPTVYLPLPQRPQPPPTINISVRAAAGSPARLIGGVLRAIGAVDGDARLTPRLLSEQVESSIVQERLVAILSGVFGALALLLAALGLYGVTAHGVSRRRAEIGIRIALGAAPAGVVALILRRVGVQIAAGVAVGVGVSLWASKFVATLLYGLEPHDPTTLVSGAIVLVTVAALAGWLPARRAATIDPARVLRE
jgi:putative ABC transport system permease protein